MAERVEVLLSARDQTAAAFQSLQRRIQTAQSALASFAGGFAGGAIAAFASSLGGLNTKGVIDAADELNKLSQRTGIAVEQLSALKYAGGLADVSTETLATSLKKLAVNMADAAGGGKETGAAFASIGVAVKDASGNLRSTDKVLEDIAGKFAGFRDGPEKAALAVKLFGKSGDALIPLLNAGADGLRAFKEEARLLGVVFSTDLAQKAEQFNDNLRKLSAASEGGKRALLEQLLPALVATTSQFVEATKEAGLFKAALITLGSGLSQRLGLDEQGQLEAQARVTSARIAELTANVEKYEKGAKLGIPLAGGLAVAARAELFELQKTAVATSKALSTLADRKQFGEHPITINRGQGPPPKSGGGGSGTADDGTALLRKQLDGRIKAIKEKLEQERDLFQFADSRLAEQFAHGELSIDAFYDAKAKIQQDALAATRKRLQDEAAVFDEFAKRFAKPQDKEDLSNRRKEALAQLAKAEREAGQAAEVAETQRQRAGESFRRDLLELDAQIAELGGDKFAAELNRAAIRFQEAQKLLAKGGGDPQREASLHSLLETQARFAEVQDDVARVTERAQTAEEAFLLAADRGGKSLLDTERGVQSLRESAIHQLDEQIAKAQELLKTSTDPALLDFYERLRLARERAFDAASPSMKRYRETLEEFGQIGGRAMEDLIVQGGKLSDVFKAAEKDFVRLAARNFLTEPLAVSFSNWLKGLADIGGQKAGGVGGGDLFSSVARLASAFGSGGSGGGGGSVAQSSSTVAALFGVLGYGHNGGIAGEMNTLRKLSLDGAAHFEQRYHDGGIVMQRRAPRAPTAARLQHDEVPVILRKGEEVLRGDDPRHRYNIARRVLLDDYVAHWRRMHDGGVVDSRSRPPGIDVAESSGTRAHILRMSDPVGRETPLRNDAEAPPRTIVVTNHFHLATPASRDTQAQVARRAGLAIQQAMQRDN